MKKTLATKDLDRFDVAILNLLQQDNQQSHSAIADKIGLSTPLLPTAGKSVLAKAAPVCTQTMAAK